MNDADAREPAGLDPGQWQTVFGLVLDELRASTRYGREPLALPVPVDPAVSTLDDAEHVVDNPGEGRLISEESR